MRLALRRAPTPALGTLLDRLSSCATCTPVLGCGWCQMGSKGACVDQPNACAGLDDFTWTWELAGSGDRGRGRGRGGLTRDCARLGGSVTV